MKKGDKEAAVSELRGRFSKANAAILGENLGLTVAEITELRNALRKASAELRVVKNTLARIASKGTDLEKLESFFTGPTAVVLSYKDQAAVAKALIDFTKEQENFKVKTGILGDRVLDVNDIKALAELPGIDQLRAKILGFIQSPASKMARIMVAPGTNVAMVLNAYSKK